MEEKKFSRWAVSAGDLAGMNPVKARDLVIKCFFEAQKETYARIKQGAGGSANDDEIRSLVTSTIKRTFAEIHEEFEKPTKTSLMKLIQALGAKAGSWGTPQDIIEHHMAQIQRILSLVK